MKRGKFILFFLFFLFSCAENVQESKTSVDEILDLTIKNADGTSVEFPDLYDSLIYVIPEDKDEKLILSEKLKIKGFKITNWGRGNCPPLGPRIISLTMTKPGCECEISKIYYSTTIDTLYSVREGIKCKKLN